VLIGLLEKLYDNYERLPEEIRLELPLKRVWMVTADQQG
jgi:predicted Mrr-cat superfamily restriction endonuclease